MSIYCRKDTGSWMVAYKDQNGKRHDKSFGKGENGQLAAQKFKEEIDKEKEIQSKSLIELDKHDIIDANYDYANTQYYQNSSNSSNNNETVQSTITLGKLIDEYIEHAYANGCGKYHLYALKRISKSDFLPFFGKDTDITSIDYGKHILPYIRNLQTKLSERGSNLCNISINQYCRYLLAMYNYAVSRGYVIANPMRFWKPLRIIRKERKITFEDACKIMDKACYHIRWAIQLVCYLGVRPGPCELFSLKWSDVDFENMKVRVYASKTNTIRYIDFTDDFANLLHEHRKNSVSEYLVEYRGKRVTTIQKGFKKACNLAGLDYNVRLYDFRHLFATQMLNNGADLAAVSKLMGHSKITTTANSYYETRSLEMKRAVSLLPKITPS